MPYSPLDRPISFSLPGPGRSALLSTSNLHPADVMNVKIAFISRGKVLQINHHGLKMYKGESNHSWWTVRSCTDVSGGLGANRFSR